MKTHKWLIVAGIVALATLVALTLVAGWTQAQGLGPADGSLSPRAVNAAVNYIPVQGRLTDTGGNPLTGDYIVTFRLYEVSSGGTALCHDTNTVHVENGLFSSEIWGDCDETEVNGRQLYLGVEVGSDGEMNPRQPIYAVPYAWSLRPGAIISSTLASDAIVHIENWATNGRGLRAYAMSATGTNYGVIGASRSPDGYGGYFYNNEGGIGLWAESDTGAALSATGSGIIKSTADITIAVSSLKTVPQWESVGNLTFLSDGAYMEVRPSASGLQYVHIPVDLPSALFGTATKLKSARICYKCDQAGSFVETTIVNQGTDSGTLSSIINDTTDRTSTSWDCYTLTDSSPSEIQGSLWIQLTLNFAGTGSSHDIRIGNIALALTEQ